MIHIDNDTVAQLVSMQDVMDALRVGFAQLSTGDAAHVPRLELWSPAAQEDAYYCMGSMAGTTKHFGVTAIRIKSDVIHWPAGRRQEKYAVQPGTFCGFVLLFSSTTGEPVALVNDGLLQRMRVGGSGGIAADYLAPPGAATVGIVGSGGMARSHLEAIALARTLSAVKVFSPTKANRELFAAELGAKLGLDIEPVATAEDAVAGTDIVVTATNSMTPPIEPEWVAEGALVIAVSRREVGPELVERADRTLQLGEFSIGSEAAVPGLEFPQSAAGGFVAGSPEERERLPWKHRAEQQRFPSLIDVIGGAHPGPLPGETVLFINLGVQGVQFAAVAGRAYELAIEAGVGSPMRQDMFLQDIRD